MRFHQTIAAVWLALACALVPAQARVAVVIGNDRYVNLPASGQLQKAASDARAVGGALRQIGFDVIESENLDREAMLTRLDDAARRLAPGDTVFFFFSGHGIAVDDTNYILPVDVPTVGSGQTARLTGAAVKEDDIVNRFQSAGARITVVVLDACRNNPFSGSGTRGIGGNKGLAPRKPPSGVFSFYAASRGEAALDRLYDGDRNPNSVFTRVLVPMLARADLDLPALAREVREEVTRLARSVDHAQRPAYYDETSGDRIFLAGPGSPGDGGHAQPAVPGGSIPKPARIEPASECGAAVNLAEGSTQARRGRVVGHLTTDEADRKIKITQHRINMAISPGYLDNFRVRVRVDGTPADALSIVLLPPDLTVRIGSRVEFIPAHLDPSRPCHYIPNVISRVLWR